MSRYFAVVSTPISTPISTLASTGWHLAATLLALTAACGDDAIDSAGETTVASATSTPSTPSVRPRAAAPVTPR